jgi:hypothetical protein
MLLRLVSVDLLVTDATEHCRHELGTFLLELFAPVRGLLLKEGRCDQCLLLL